MRKRVQLYIGPTVTCSNSVSTLSINTQHGYDIELFDEYTDTDGTLVKNDKYITSVCKNVQGAVSQGLTEDEAITNIAEAIQGIEECNNEAKDRAAA
jgi:predicted RNase H-like HicB family nuclease